MTNVWGMAIRATRSAGIQSPEHAIDVSTALRLYTLGTAELNSDSDRLGTISAGKLADVVAYPLDPVTANPEDLRDLKPAFTLIGGRPAWDRDGRLSALPSS